MTTAVFFSPAGYTASVEVLPRSKMHETGGILGEEQIVETTDNRRQDRQSRNWARKGRVVVSFTLRQ